ncbi:MAG TPA: hypothetical protein VFC07_09875 [Verrucomicrobiae bacterium]|nr:hypothetical protein [Verrucomicrobiae bacterium]
MKHSLLARRAALASLLAMPIASTQATGNGSSALFQPNDEDEPLNRFSLSYSMGLNITAGFKNVQLVPNYYSVPNHAGVLTPTLINPGSTNGLGSHVYDNGYSQADASSNALGFTSYWGYQTASQVQNGTIVMNATTPTLGAGPQDLNGDPQHGLQFTYGRQLGRHNQFRWGLEAGFGFTDVTIRDNQIVSGDYTTTTDAYTLPPIPGGGVVSPPPPPYKGPFSAPPGSPLIGDAPSRTVTPVAGTDQFTLDAHVFSWRLGPYFQVPVIKHRLDFSLNGGLALFYVNSQFSFQESVPRTGLPPLLNSGSGSHNDLLVGGYVGGNLSYRLTRSVDLFTGVQYTKVGSTSNVQSGKQAQIDFGNSLFVALGLTYKF